jgi:glycosyltransferase involved in cell wall biosynthesis
VPDPPDAGAKLRNLALLRLLATDHEVDAIAFGPEGEQARLQELVRKAVVIAPPGRPSAQRLLDALSSPEPDMARRLWSPRFAANVRQRLAETTYDVVQAEGIEMAPYLSGAPPHLRVYDAHNAETLLQRRACEAALRRRDLRAALYSRLQWRRLARFEARVVGRCCRTLAVSYHDANQLEALAPGARIDVVPNAIDVASYPFRQPTAHDAPNLLFVGKLDYRPHVESLRWLVEAVLPQVPRARLFAVGANPPRWLVKAGQRDDRVAVTGAVPDERPYLARSAALLLPLEVAAGSRLKALVAMASGVPIVSTAIGMEGLDAEAGEHFLKADDLQADTWGTLLAELLGNPERRLRLARNARRLVESCYDWSAIAPALRAAYTR